MSIRIGVYGASGYTGQELIALLDAHQEFALTFAVSDQFAGQKVPQSDLTYRPSDAVDIVAVDMVFLCTPHGASAPLAAQALDAGAKVVDLSADLRFQSATEYQQWYQQPHPAPALLPTPYGIPELNRYNLININAIANPGCYPTAALLAVAPLAKVGALESFAPVIVDAKSGVSGAGRAPSETTHFVEVYGDTRPYKIGRQHRHTGEIDQELRIMFPDAGPVIFSPHLLPIDRGLICTAYIPLKENWTQSQIREVYEAQYYAEPFIRLLPYGETARVKDAVRTNGAVISLHHPVPEMVLVVCAIDNLRKGAASQAIQNANLMFNLPETAGLITST
ncbi:MAG: N-acetyl-gamma-glutamyl-phosphate reductase [Chloroflexi bacterium]|nr:N-acetyl-gamma-glutamyl-phosphate reductase [Chloroflexota bacterium]